MSKIRKARRESARTAGPPRRWRPIVLLSQQAGITRGATFRRTRDGGVEIRWRRSGRPVASQISAAELARPATVASSEAFTRELATLTEHVRQRLATKAPRGVSGRVAALSAAVKCAAQEVFLYMHSKLPPRGQSLRLPTWILELAKAAADDGVDVGMHGSKQPDAVCLVAYAVFKFSEIDWDKTSLKCPVADGLVDREYFQKQYLSGVDTVTVDGIALASRILEKADPSWSLPRNSPLDPKRLPRELRRLREDLHRAGNRLIMKAKVISQLAEQSRDPSS